MSEAVFVLGWFLLAREAAPVFGAIARVSALTGHDNDRIPFGARADAAGP
jgi:hypothetical protein